MNLILSSQNINANSFLILNSNRKKTNKYTGIIIYSLFMLKNYSNLNKILEKIKTIFAYFV